MKTMCSECFALTEECECEPEMVEVAVLSMDKKSKGKWEPNISKNEKWENVTSPYKKYSEGV